MKLRSFIIFEDFDILKDVSSSSYVISIIYLSSFFDIILNIKNLNFVSVMN